MTPGRPPARPPQPTASHESPQQTASHTTRTTHVTLVAARRA